MHSLIKVCSHPERGSIFNSMSRLRLASRGEAIPVSARIRICTQVCPTPKPELCVRALGFQKAGIKAMLGADSVLQSLLNSPSETQVTGSVHFRVLALPLTPDLPCLSLTCIFIFNFLLSGVPSKQSCRTLCCLFLPILQLTKVAFQGTH